MSDSVRPHRRQPTRLPRSWDSLDKNTGVGCHFLLQCMCAKPLQSCLTLCNPMDSSHQAPLSMGFSKQEYWRGLPFPSPQIRAMFLNLVRGRTILYYLYISLECAISSSELCVISTLYSSSHRKNSGITHN